MICPTHQSMRSMWSTCFCFSSYRERISARRIHGYLGGIEAGRSEVREAGEYSAATLDTVRAAMKLLGGIGSSDKATGSSSGKTTGGKKRGMSAPPRAKTSKATKKRRAKC